MTPLTDKAKKHLDPEYTIGMGALMEDEEKGLRCPVRGCGKWMQTLDKHANTKHADIGGAAGLKKLLDLPPKLGLSSQRYKRSRVKAGVRLAKQPSSNSRKHRFKSGDARQRKGVKVASKRQGWATIRNLNDRCDAQLAHRIIDLRNKIGRVPCAREFRQEYGATLENAVCTAFGSWNAALAYAGYKVNRRYYKPEHIYEMFAEYYNRHGVLPRTSSVRRGATPRLPPDNTVMRVLQVETWAEAMRLIRRRVGKGAAIAQDKRYGPRPNLVQRATV